ncbi:Thiol-disulfide isomerase or thioredoxin [Polaribacter sp. KT25b]|uniref:TlpA family protein disulfide reductase n=1 Tax=Polaribacter sp. KT25b TaxID=1855336 RepID=UPI00087BCB5F|nr:redoxin family protein [Polaribacter sp. KT25b]SDR94705.1 Thiol-disulfide isomerase or thioredoxin [Polaribacter sp. KT25b]
MKKITLITIMNFLIISCGKQKENKITSENFFKAGTIQFTGKVKNFKLTDDRTLFISQYNVLTGEDEVSSIKINKDGKFEKIIPIYSPHEITLKYKNKRTILLVNYLDSLNFIFDVKNKTIISGKGSNRNNLLQQYIESSYKIKNNYFDAIFGKEFELLLKEHSKTKRKLDSITDMIFLDKKPDSLLDIWIKTDKKTLKTYGFINYALKNEPFPTHFLSEKKIINDSDLNNINSYYNKSFTIDVFNLYIGAIVKGNRENFNKMRTLFKKGSYEEATNLLADSIFKKYKNLGKDIVLYREFKQMTQKDLIRDDPNIDLLKRQFLKKIKNEFIKTNILNESFKSNSAQKEKSTINNSDNVLADLIKKHEGKTLYVDISATWCGPCIAEFPYSVNLHESLKNENIVFVYLFAKSNQDTWKKLSTKYKLKGENLIISDNQYNLLLSEYGINTGFPQYFIVDKNKEIKKNIKRPSTTGMKEYLLKIL